MDDSLRDLMAEFEKSGSSSSSTGRKSGKELEWATTMILLLQLLRSEDAKDKDDMAEEDLTPAVSHLWLALAHAGEALARSSRGEAATCDGVVTLVHHWLGKAVRRAPFDANVRHAAGRMLYKLLDLEVVAGEDRQKTLEQACLELEEAAYLAPGRFDILNDWATVLATQAEATEEPQRTALHREAVRRYDEAARCFNAGTRRFSRTGKAHPEYLRAVTCAGVLRWGLGNESDDQEEKRKLLRRGYRQIRLGMEDEDREEPVERMVAGQAALDLAWLPGNREARRELFEEACGHFAVAAEGRSVKTEPVEIDEVCLSWGSATLGSAALSTGTDRQELIGRAEELFAQAALHNPGAHDLAAGAWLRLAAESSAEEERDAARRAAEAARQANQAEAGSGDYNLACALSHLKQFSEAAEVLTAALARDPETASRALSDPNLEPLREAKPELQRAIAAGFFG
jgi:tetratricopeptide (TPR) repeat protein